MIDDIYARRAVNTTAARVLAKGTHFVGDKKILTADSELPIKTRALPHNMEDLRGVNFGRMTVIGVAADAKGRWVVKCSCGVYTLRSTKAVKNPANEIDCCEQCRHLRHLKEKDKFLRTHKNSK
jgi:hypothetical protein